MLALEGTVAMLGLIAGLMALVGTFLVNQTITEGRMEEATTTREHVTRKAA